MAPQALLERDAIEPAGSGRPPRSAPRRRSTLDTAARDREDRRLLERYHRDGDGQARERLAERWMTISAQLVRRYQRRDEPPDELIGVASLGVAKAIDRYDLGRDTPFAAYAIPTILGELRRHFRDQGWGLRVSRSIQERVLDINNALPKLNQRLGRSPTTREIAEAIGATTEEVLEALDAEATHTPISLQAQPVGQDADARAYEDTIGKEDSSFALVEHNVALSPAIRALPERERLVLHLRFVEDLTQTEIADRIGISQMHVSRLLRRILARLRAHQEAGDRQLEP